MAFISLHALSGWLQRQGYTIGESDYRKWGGWTWVKARMPNGQLVIYRKKGMP